MNKILIALMLACLSSCSLYELRPGEYRIDEPESNFKERDPDEFIFRTKNHEDL